MILTCRETLSDEINFYFAYNYSFDANFSTYLEQEKTDLTTLKVCSYLLPY